MGLQREHEAVLDDGGGLSLGEFGVVRDFFEGLVAAESAAGVDDVLGDRKRHTAGSGDDVCVHPVEVDQAAVGVAVPGQPEVPCGAEPMTTKTIRPSALTGTPLRQTCRRFSVAAACSSGMATRVPKLRIVTTKYHLPVLIRGGAARGGATSRAAGGRTALS